MKAFNKNKAIKHIKIKQNKDTYIKKLSISLSCLLLLVCVILFTFAKFESSSDTYTMITGQLGEYIDETCSYNNGQVWNFSYTGDVQNFTVPCTGNYKIELWGSQGTVYTPDSSQGGLGAYTAGNIDLDKNYNLYFYVGGTADYSVKNVKTFNNGTSSSNGWNSGGATDVRIVNGEWDYFNSLKSRIMVAASGGTFRSTGSAGAGGGLTGYAGGHTAGGTQTGPGSTSYVASTFGVANGGCTGGNGYYPGGGATCVNGSGGGSSFISGYSGCNAIDASSTESNIVHTNQPNHYSGKVFTNGVMIDGKGCTWASGSAANCGTKQPQPSGSNAVGHSGNGYARITLVSKTSFHKVPKCIFEVGKEWQYDYTGSAQSFVAPCSGNYKIELWGAQGGSSPQTGSCTVSEGSTGGYVSGNTNITKNNTLYVYVGQHATVANGASFNGSLGSSSCGAAGGGATDIRTVNGTWNSDASLRSRVMVAAGGGNTSDVYVTNNFGGFYQATNYGGGLIGGNGESQYHTDTNQTQASRYLYSNPPDDSHGAFGVGAKYGAGGGGGWYGGSGGGWSYGGGTGGSSYISGHTGCVGVTSTSSSAPKSGCTTGTTSNVCSISPYGYTFTNTKMIDGGGYNWTNTKGSKINQNQPYGAATEGHLGNGYARITLVSIN